MNPHRGRLTADGSATVIRFVRTFSVEPSELWQAIATREGLAAWLGHGEFEGRLGGDIRFEFDEDQIVTGEILVWDPYTELTYTWNINDDICSTLTYRIEATGSGSTMTLTHTKLPTEMARGYTPGWHAYLERLDQRLNGRRVEAWDDLFAKARPLYVDGSEP